MRTVYKITQQICGKKQRNSIPVKDKQGKLLMSEQEQDQRWTKHFSEVLNRPDPVNSHDILTAPDDLDIMSTDAPTREEPKSPRTGCIAGGAI